MRKILCFLCMAVLIFFPNVSNAIKFEDYVDKIRFELINDGLSQILKENDFQWEYLAEDPTGKAYLYTISDQEFDTKYIVIFHKGSEDNPVDGIYTFIENNTEFIPSAGSTFLHVYAMVSMWLCLFENTTQVYDVWDEINGFLDCLDSYFLSNDPSPEYKYICNEGIVGIQCDSDFVITFYVNLL